jgi:UDP-N-acetylmuramoyl-tripeptide--D-alanyl-D-alanine ligase
MIVMSSQLPSFKDLAQQINATYKGDNKSVKSIGINSRTIKPDQWFAAIKGPNFDGHDFILDAINKGAEGLIVSSYQNKFENIPQIVVENTTLGLGQLAKAWRESFNIPVIGITGSTGKTSIKEMLLSILKQRFNVIATPGNYNNEYGLPLSIMQLKPEHEIAIIEMGINAPEEMKYLTDIAQPTVGLISNIQPAHIGQFSSLEQILEEKTKIFESEKINIAIINTNDEQLKAYSENLEAIHTIKYSSKPTSKESTDISSSEVGWVHSVGGIVMQFKLHTPISDEIIALPLIGEHWIDNALAASACALSVGAQPIDIKEGLKKITPIKGRMFPYFLHNDRILIDDTYNSSCQSVKNCIKILSKLPEKRLFICSTLTEVGDFTEDLHQQIAKELKNAKFDYVYMIGDPKITDIMQQTYDQIKYIPDLKSLNKVLPEHLTDEKIKSILIKGARVYELNEAVSHALKQTQVQFCTQ